MTVLGEIRYTHCYMMFILLYCSQVSLKLGTRWHSIRSHRYDRHNLSTFIRRRDFRCCRTIYRGFRIYWVFWCSWEEEGWVQQQWWRRWWQNTSGNIDQVTGGRDVLSSMTSMYLRTVKKIAQLSHMFWWRNRTRPSWRPNVWGKMLQRMSFMLRRKNLPNVLTKMHCRVWPLLLGNIFRIGWMCTALCLLLQL